MNICYCGAMAGYPHEESCPYPLFHAAPDSKAEKDWYEARRKKLTETIDLD